jgi:hypothetical protein
MGYGGSLGLLGDQRCGVNWGLFLGERPAGYGIRGMDSRVMYSIAFLRSGSGSGIVERNLGGQGLTL